MAEFIDVDYQI